MFAHGFTQASAGGAAAANVVAARMFWFPSLVPPLAHAFLFQEPATASPEASANGKGAAAAKNTKSTGKGKRMLSRAIF